MLQCAPSPCLAKGGEHDLLVLERWELPEGMQRGHPGGLGTRAANSDAKGAREGGGRQTARAGSCTRRLSLLITHDLCQGTVPVSLRHRDNC